MEIESLLHWGALGKGCAGISHPSGTAWRCCPVTTAWRWERCFEAALQEMENSVPTAPQNLLTVLPVDAGQLSQPVLALQGCWPGAAPTHTVLQQSRWDHSQWWEVRVVILIIRKLRQSDSARIKIVIKLEIACGFPKSYRCWEHFEAKAFSGSAQH